MQSGVYSQEGGSSREESRAGERSRGERRLNHERRGEGGRGVQVKRGEKLKGAPFRFSLFRPSILVAPSTQARMITQYPKIQEFLGAVFCASVCGACCWAGAEPKLLSSSSCAVWVLL